MNIERIGFALCAILTHERDEELSLSEHNQIRLACNRIVEKADKEDIKIVLCANPDLAIKATKDFDKLNEIFSD